MAPKGSSGSSKAPAASKKTENKKKEKVIEDKTFGLKNKKGAKQQRFIQQVEKQVKSGGPPRKQEDQIKKKEEKLKEAKELNLIFKPVQKVEKGADPKSILCSYYKIGQCAKGSKCKFSHDLETERKAEKRSLYVDMRDDEEEGGMETWSEEKLKEVVEKKHGESNKNMPTTEIICKYFVDAVENSKYGWFWSCPNGSTCIYRHALPPGFVLKKDQKKEDKNNVETLEELIEKERAALTSSNTTKLTLETFLEWKKRKVKEKNEVKQKEDEKKRVNFKAGHHIGLSGRDMFSFNPELAKDDIYDEGDEVFDSYGRNEEEDDDTQYFELDVNALGFTLQEEKEGTNTVKANTDSADLQSDEKNTDVCEGPLNEKIFKGDDLEDIDKELEKCKLTDHNAVKSANESN